MLAAGIPISETLLAVSESTTHIGFSAVIRDLKMNVEAGISLDVSLSRHPKVFSSQIINLVKAGEYSGNLPVACEDISLHLEWVEKILAEIKQASIYPITILIAVMGLVMLMFMFVVPRFNEIFISLDLELPLLTRIVVDIGNFTTQYWWLMLALPLAVFSFLKYAPRYSPSIAWKLDRLILNLPVFGNLNRMLQQSRFCHNLGLLLKSGIPILDALSLCKDLVTNQVMKKAVSEAEAAVNEGKQMTDVLGKHDIISPIVLRMMMVGEKTGQLEDTMEHASQRFDKEIPRLIKQVFSIIEPLIMITLIAIVGIIGGAVFLPMFSLMSGV
ncbi:MAG: type II secretion system F family protein [Gammaproteobacteria bacterium]|nr:type II secretion system F family protein [Gammaproteobacteria bacterium]